MHIRHASHAPKEICSHIQFMHYKLLKLQNVVKMQSTKEKQSSLFRKLCISLVRAGLH